MLLHIVCHQMDELLRIVWRNDFFVGWGAGGGGAGGAYHAGAAAGWGAEVWARHPGCSAAGMNKPVRKPKLRWLKSASGKRIGLVLAKKR